MLLLAQHLPSHNNQPLGCHISAPCGGITSIFWERRIDIIEYTWLKFHGLVSKIERDRPSFALSGALFSLTQQSTTWMSYLGPLPRCFFDNFNIIDYTWLKFHGLSKIEGDRPWYARSATKTTNKSTGIFFD